MTALRKLPRSTGLTLYRGLKCGIKLSEDYYRKWNVVTWQDLTSTSKDMEVVETFLAEGSKSGKAEGTMFIIENAWGYDIKNYSLTKNKEEIILEPERKFIVTSVIQGKGLSFINLQMLDTPLQLTDVFGEGKCQE